MVTEKKGLLNIASFYLVNGCLTAVKVKAGKFISAAASFGPRLGNISFAAAWISSGPMSCTFIPAHVRRRLSQLVVPACGEVVMFGDNI